ncbi:MAG: nitrous oxide-stimulated promoter family protein [Raoultibacter sp.]|jgi:hypothetical protein
MAKTGDISKKIQQELATIEKMIALYCKNNHSSDTDLCDECTELLAYAHSRIDHCPIKDEKVFCSECTIHCYKPAMRERIRTVMRYSGPRMLWHDPIMAFRHLAARRRSKRAAKQSSKTPRSF